MKNNFFLFPLFALSLLIAVPALANEAQNQQQDVIKKSSEESNILNLSQVKLPSTDAKLLTQQASKQPKENKKTELVTGNLTQNNNLDNSDNSDNSDIYLEVVGEKDTLPQSTPTYVIEKKEIQKQGATSVADVLKRMPGFAINNVGHGADIHTGTYYRGASINQTVILINGRPINTNINTYHGATDLNSIPVEAIDRVELYSGTATTLYGSSSFGGVVNIITKEGGTTPKFNATAEVGSLNLNNQQASFSGGNQKIRYNLGFEHYFIDNRYKVPVGAANRDESGNLFNADTATNTFFGGVAVDLDKKNTINLDVKTLSSRRGLVYFGFPLQKDRLDHDGLDIGVSWKSKLAQGSNLTTTVGYNKDYFNTYGPTVSQGREYYRTGALDTQQLTTRVEHEWQIVPKNQLRWGLDLNNTNLNSQVVSTVPSRIALNETEDRSLLNTALFAVNTFNITDAFTVDLGLRQSFDSQFGNYLNPSAGFRYAFSPDIAVRGSWAGGQRNPGLDQLYTYDTVHNWLPNSNLKPEIGSSWTAGVDVNLLQNLAGQFTYFGSSLDNSLSVIQGQWQNIGLVDTNGFEAALRWKVASNWSTFVNYTYTDAQVKTGASKGLQSGLIPLSLAQAGIGYEKDGWQGNLYATYNSGSRRALFTNSADKSTDFTPSYLNLDLSGRVPLNKNLGLNIYLENLTGQQYERVNRIYSPGLTFRIGLSSSF